MLADHIEAHVGSKQLRHPRHGCIAQFRLGIATDRDRDALASNASPPRESGIVSPSRSLCLKSASCNADRNGRSWGCQCTRLASRILPTHPQASAHLSFPTSARSSPATACTHPKPMLLDKTGSESEKTDARSGNGNSHRIRGIARGSAGAASKDPARSFSLLHSRHHLSMLQLQSHRSHDEFGMAGWSYPAARARPSCRRRQSPAAQRRHRRRII
jgi:hypothetical protein